MQTMPYMPPELLAHSQLTPQADVYSFGMVMWEIYTGQVRQPCCMLPGACCSWRCHVTFTRSLKTTPCLVGMMQYCLGVASY